MTTESKYTPTPKLITLNCSGGISLGAYMAGIFYELTKEAIKPDAKINIDIITGASAGAMSGVLAAYCLLQGSTNQTIASNEQNSPLYQAWVEQADIEAIDSMGVLLSSFKDGIQATLESFEDSVRKTIDKYQNSSNPIQKFLAQIFSSFKNNLSNKFLLLIQNGCTFMLALFL
jgi:predicted acylesterase/phospholipase RssA